MIDVFQFVKECSSCLYQQSNFVAGIGADIDGLESLRTKNNKKILISLKKYILLQNKEILDIGCSSGYLLDTLKELGIEAEGIEPDVHKAKKAIYKGHTVKIGIFPKDVTKTFDLLFFNDVFEHLTDIKAAKRNILDTLNEDGIVVIAVPNSNGLYYRFARFLYTKGIKGLFERLWQKGFPSPHISYFNDQNITQLFKDQQVLFVDKLSGLTIEGLYERLRATNGVFFSFFLFIIGLVMSPLEILSKDNIVIGIRKIN